mmetsp:Transcript_12499/g.24197  ORF Transcript_12499/g.24197 Transcript_12499/m.24197 type:complete len:216 (+) Transcript_12499:461-1108(+)
MVVVVSWDLTVSKAMLLSLLLLLLPPPRNQTRLQRVHTRPLHVRALRLLRRLALLPKLRAHRHPAALHTLPRLRLSSRSVQRGRHVAASRGRPFRDFVSQLPQRRGRVAVTRILLPFAFHISPLSWPRVFGTRWPATRLLLDRHELRGWCIPRHVRRKQHLHMLKGMHGGLLVCPELPSHLRPGLAIPDIPNGFRTHAVNLSYQRTLPSNLCQLW